MSTAPDAMVSVCRVRRECCGRTEQGWVAQENLKEAELKEECLGGLDSAGKCKGKCASDTGNSRCKTSVL